MADIPNALNDAFKMGLGALDMAREEAGRVAERFQESHAAEIAEGRKMLDERLRKAKKDAAKAQAKIRATVQTAVQKQDLVPEKDLTELVKAVERLGAATHTIATTAAASAVRKVKAARKSARKAAKAPARKVVRKAPARKAAKRKPAVKRAAKRKPAKAPKRKARR